MAFQIFLYNYPIYNFSYLLKSMMYISRLPSISDTNAIDFPLADKDGFVSLTSL